MQPTARARHEGSRTVAIAEAIFGRDRLPLLPQCVNSRRRNEGIACAADADGKEY